MKKPVHRSSFLKTNTKITSLHEEKGPATYLKGTHLEPDLDSLYIKKCTFSLICLMALLLKDAQQDDSIILRILFKSKYDACISYR